MNGFDVIRAIKADHAVPVIVLTSGSSLTNTLTPEDYLKTALSLGAVAAFLKPVSGDDLMDTIRQHVPRAA